MSYTPAKNPCTIKKNTHTPEPAPPARALAPTVKTSTFAEVSALQCEGLVLIGAGGDPCEWVSGIEARWKAEGITVTENPIENAYILRTTNGRTDLVLVYKQNAVRMPLLAFWRLRFGDCSWLSDYCINYKSQHQ